MSTHPEKTVYDHEIPEHMEATAKSAPERPVLIMLDGNETNRRHPIIKRELTMGRDLSCDVVLHDSRCSRQHAKLVFTNVDQTDQAPNIVLRDLNSTNGVFVNGIRVSEHTLREHDKILVGSSLFGFFLRDECELEADQRLYFMARNDALTGLLNRGIFNMEIQKEFERAQRYGRTLGLVLFDIDHFKTFNDTYGHQMGDYVLQELGRIVRANIRGHDIGARYGGEEFAIILPETPLEGGLIQAERLRQAVVHHAFVKDGISLRITVSLGIASNDHSILSMDELIRAADRSLYQAKAAGRNCIGWMQNGQIRTEKPELENGITTPPTDRYFH